MKEKIKEVQLYFKNKILNGLYEIVEISDHTAAVVIDGEYKFNLWISVPSFFGQYVQFADGDTFMKLPDFSESEKIKGSASFVTMRRIYNKKHQSC